jgi:hypothetical protein
MLAKRNPSIAEFSVSTEKIAGKKLFLSSYLHLAVIS